MGLNIDFILWTLQIFCIAVLIPFLLPEKEDVFTVLFEFCRVSDSTLQSILGSLDVDRLCDSCQDNIRKNVVVSLAQVML